MTYHITGLVSSAIFLLTIGGLWAQLGLVWRRRQQTRLGGEVIERPTAVLSVNPFVSSFLAFFSFFLYGACRERFNHYLVWPRLSATTKVVTLWHFRWVRLSPLAHQRRATGESEPVLAREAMS